MLISEKKSPPFVDQFWMEPTHIRRCQQSPCITSCDASIVKINLQRHNYCEEQCAFPYLIVTRYFPVQFLCLFCFHTCNTTVRLRQPSLYIPHPVPGVRVGHHIEGVSAEVQVQLEHPDPLLSLFRQINMLCVDLVHSLAVAACPDVATTDFTVMRWTSSTRVIASVLGYSAASHSCSSLGQSVLNHDRIQSFICKIQWMLLPVH